MTTPSRVYDYNDHLSFFARWIDDEVFNEKQYILHYYPYDDKIEIYDARNKHLFLKRSTCENITQNDIFVGNSVRIYGRQINIIDYADERTKVYVGKTKQHAFCLLKPGVIPKLGEIIARIEAKDFRIIKMRMCQFSRIEALTFYGTRKGNHFLPFILEHVVSGPVIGISVVGDDAIQRLIEETGPSDPQLARVVAPNSLRALYGQERDTNGFHISQNAAEAHRDILEFFAEEDIDRKPPTTTVQFVNSSCCVIKPHAILEGKMGYIIKDIMESQFQITAMQMFYLTKANAEHFLEVYKDVISDFNSMLLGFVDGPCVALEISARNSDINVHQEFRQFVGPRDPNIAKHIRPCTLRAKYGVDKYNNAVHCTDLPEDTVLELQYFFKILN